MAGKGYFLHPSSFVDDPCLIGAGTKIWHFCHVMKDSVIGRDCNIGQNVVVSPGVRVNVYGPLSPHRPHSRCSSMESRDR